MNLPVVQQESQALPPLYAAWIRSLLNGPIPAEGHATCEDCAMCDSQVAPHGDATWFNPQVKCCTYLPDLPNFIVGRILLDTDPRMLANRKPFEKRLAGDNVSPMGIAMRAEYSVLYKNFKGRFGHDADMLCPHYLADSGHCGIWRQRNSVCATWFCKYVRGAVGDRFWSSLLQLLRNIEQQLSLWCISELNPGDDATAMLFAFKASRSSGVDDTADLNRNSPRYKTLWGRWLGREREFFQKCGQLVSPLSWDQVLNLCGQETRAFARTLVIAYQHLLDDRVPAALQTASLQVAGIGPDSIRLVGYHPMDPVDIPRELFDAFSRFDGRPTGVILRDIAKSDGLDLDEDLVRSLVDFNILPRIAQSPIAGAGLIRRS